MRASLKIVLALGVIAMLVLAIADRVYAVPEWESQHHSAARAQPPSGYPDVQLWGEVPRGWSVQDPRNLVLRAEYGKITWQGRDVSHPIVPSYINGLIDSQKAEGILIVFAKEAKFTDVISVVDTLRLTRAKWITIYNET